MKVILSYEPYFGQGKKYQAKFIYDNTSEAKDIISCMNGLNANEQFKPVKENINTISKTNIPEEVLLPFINMILILRNTTVIIGNQEFTKENKDSIKDAIDNLHINITLKQGKYFNFKNCYYVTFKYASDTQREEVSYDFNVHLNSIIGRDSELGQTGYLFPFTIGKSGNITFENTGIIGGTNIPEQTLPFFLRKFINEYNAVITIGNRKYKSAEDIDLLLKALTTQKHGNPRIRKPN